MTEKTLKLTDLTNEIGIELGMQGADENKELSKEDASFYISINTTEEVGSDSYCHENRIEYLGEFDDINHACLTLTAYAFGYRHGSNTYPERHTHDFRPVGSQSK